MATTMIQQTTGRTGRGQSWVNRRAKRYLLAGILGGAILLALAVGLAIQQGADTQAATVVPAAVVPGNAALAMPFRLSSPNELATDTTGAIPANSAPVGYQVSAPNEANPDSTIAAPTTYAPYRISAPNEQEPSVP